MLQGLMHHIVLQQRVTLDCALLSHLQDCLLTPYTEDMHTYRTYSFNELACSMYIYTVQVAIYHGNVK